MGIMDVVEAAALLLEYLHFGFDFGQLPKQHLHCQPEIPQPAGHLHPKVSGRDSVPNSVVCAGDD